ncbi:putative bifunctional diguanylate cyclase/phosphodiesterase [Paractinoplanes pyxinae]|uniref:putative bifunctional diguanylate cyclase/phosphodiesterase n=1 Tax=Paractinoplanes pyxinae TaxID=2997416 RepID=UPI003F694858
MASTSSNDDATDRRLRLFVGLVVVLALGAAGTVVAFAAPQLTTPPDFLTIGLILLAIMVAGWLRVRFRVLSNQDVYTWVDVPVVIGFVLVPAPWVILCWALATTIRRLAMRRGLLKDTWQVAKDTLAGSAAAGVFLALNVEPSTSHPPFAIGAVVLALIAIAVVDQAAFVPVIAISSHKPLGQVARKNLDVKLVGQVFRLIATLIALALLSYEANVFLLLLLPMIVACLQLWQTGSMRTREERESWQRLAEATDALNAVDLTQVLHSAVSRAAVIFSAGEAEIDLTSAGTDRVVTGSAGHIRYDGPARPDEPKQTDDELATDLVAHDGTLRVGMLRLRFGGAIKLTEFEQYKLKTFASALCTAIRNASAYAELERINAQNAHDAAHDALTGLANRRQLYERAGRQFDGKATDGVVALLLIDLNHFKEINDTLGHAAGDTVLRKVARRLSESAAPGDMVARLGGDEFAVLLTDLPTPAMAGHRADAMLSSLDEAIEVEGMRITVEAAGGIALAPGSGGVNELMRRADIAMYQAKRAGVQTATYAHSQDTADVSRLMLGGELQRAVAEREFVVDFQPIVDLGSGEVAAAEALARWHHPEHGALTPMEFLQTVERSGRLPAFADAVLEQALEASDLWREAGFDLPVAVNVSPRSLLDPSFPETVLARLNRHAVPADRLIFELAETLTLSQLDVVGRALNELSEAGVRLALDDFGTGVTPLSVLSHIPVHQLKIDREFVGSVQTSSEAAAVIRSTVDLARSLHLTVIAEGVESEPQRHALWSLGCVAGQGHLFARPMSAARLLATLQRGTAGRPGALASSLHDGGAVVRMSRRRSGGSGRSALPHLPA